MCGDITYYANNCVCAMQVPSWGRVMVIPSSHNDLSPWPALEEGFYMLTIQNTEANKTIGTRGRSKYAKTNNISHIQMHKLYMVHTGGGYDDKAWLV